MKIPATPIALVAFSLGMMIVPAAAADRNASAAPTTQVALQPAPGSADAVDVGAPNCLLPGQIRSFGGLTMLTPRRPVTLAAAACAARGGEPITGRAAAD